LSASVVIAGVVVMVVIVAVLVVSVVVVVLLNMTDMSLLIAHVELLLVCPLNPARAEYAELLDNILFCDVPGQTAHENFRRINNRSLVLLWRQFTCKTRKTTEHQY